jgi:hypothetical protein
VVDEINTELGISLDINNVMHFVVLPGLMEIALVLDSMIFYLMLVSFGTIWLCHFTGTMHVTRPW